MKVQFPSSVTLKEFRSEITIPTFGLNRDTNTIKVGQELDSKTLRTAQDFGAIIL